MPEISVLMSVYNGEKYIKETIDSILNQSFIDFEFIIVNDASTDATKEIINSYNDKRIKLYNLEKNHGVGLASNYGVKKCSGKYIARADSDDIYHPDRLLLQKQFLDNNKQICLVKTLIEYFGSEEIQKTDRFKGIKNHLEKDKNRYTSSEDIKNILLWYVCVSNSSIMIRAEILNKYLYKDLRIAEDYDLFYRLNEDGYMMGTVEKCLTKVRVSDTSLTANNRLLLYDTVYNIKKQHIDKLFQMGNVYLWGASVFGQNLNKILKSYNLKINGYIDIDIKKQGNKIDEIEIYSPNILNNSYKVIVASQPGRESIVRELEKMGKIHLQDYVVFL